VLIDVMQPAEHRRPMIVLAALDMDGGVNPHGAR
jgi:hypothetical protein